MEINIFEKGGLLDRYLEGYQERPGQIQMSRLIFNGLHDPDPHAPNVIIAEGPVGVGKSFAYTFSSLLDPEEGKLINGKIVISTSSIALQNQLENKDLPFVRDVIKDQMGKEFAFATLKGISNYVCLYNFHQFESELSRDLQGYVNDQILFGKDHDRPLGEKPDHVNPEEWEKITVDSSECIGRDCPLFQECFYQRQKRKVAKADVIVINHALFAAHWLLRQNGGRGILPEDIRFWIFDECHELEDSMANFFSSRLSERVIQRLVSGLTRAVEQMRKKWVVEEEALGESELEKAHARWSRKIAEARLDELVELIKKIAQDHPEGLIREKYDVSFWIQALTSLAEDVGQFTISYYDPDAWEDVEFTPEAISKYSAQIFDVVDRLDWLHRNPQDIAIYVSLSSNGTPSLMFTPVNINEFLAPFWENRSHRCVLTSATCSVNQEFSFLCERLGINEDQTITGVFESPFSYESQGLLVVPYYFDPKDKEMFDNQVLYGIDQIVNFGAKNDIHKTLILFTSYRQMENLVPYIKFRYQGRYDVFDQNPGMSREFLIRKFQESPRSILVAQAASFGTGIDVKGNKNVIIAKLSFDVPTDPLFVARSEVVSSEGKNPFTDLSIPNVIIRTKQQIGRSIRSTSDRAVIAILDGRLNRTGWGRRVLNSLPPMQRMLVKDWTNAAVKAWMNASREEAL